MNDRGRLDDTARSLAAARREVFEALLTAAAIVHAHAERGDPLAEYVSDMLDRAFLRMSVEHIGAKTLLVELEERKNDDQGFQ